MIEDVVLRRIKPSPMEEQKLNKFLGKLLHTAHSVSGLKCVPCGSIGKETWLSGDHDIDLFILFNKETTRQDLERKGLGFGKEIAKRINGRTVLKYAEHPYTQIHASGYIIDVVPCYSIEKGEKIISAVDRSPLHLEFVREHLKNKDDVRLLKQFCKGIGVYGSDAMHLGFSGYVCEILAIKYGSFKKVLEEAAGWNAPVTVSILTPQGKFLRTPLIVIDPVDVTRNAAANINEENFVKFVESAKAYSRKKSKDYFFQQKKSTLSKKEITLLQRRNTFFLAIEIKKPNIIDDILYPQLRRALHRLKNLSEEHSFSVMRSYEFVSDKVFLIFEFEVFSMPSTEKMTGPPIYSRQHSKEFLEKYKKDMVYIEEARWTAEKNRKYVHVLDLFRSFVSKNEKDLEACGIPNNIARVMRSCKITTDLKSITKNKALSILLKEKYFD